MKKRIITALLVIACILSFTACGASETAAAPTELELTDEQRQQWYDSASQFVLAMNEAVETGQAQAQMDDPVYGPAFSGWENALRDIGEVQGIEGKSCSFTKKDGTVTVTVKGSRHDADVVFTMESADQAYFVTAITTNVEYSMNEQVGQAGMNTLLGMGTTFAILILLALVITLFGTIMNRAAGKADKAAKKQTPPRPAPVPEPVAAPVEKSTAGTAAEGDELIAVLAAAVAAAESNGELTAVISAAVAAYEEDEEKTRTHRVDEYVARTIRKARRK